jgi:hypothetical protein
MRYDISAIIITVIGIILLPIFIFFSIAGGTLMLYDVSYGLWYTSWPFFGGMLISLKFILKSNSKHIFRFYFFFLLFIILGGMSFIFMVQQISKIELISVSKKIEIYLREIELNNYSQDEMREIIKPYGMAIHFPSENQYDIYILSHNGIKYYSHDKRFVVSRRLGD